MRLCYEKLKKIKPILKWQDPLLMQFATKWVNKPRIKKGAAPEASPWWLFIHSWYDIIKKALSDFIAGNYSFNPMITYRFENETIIIWDYRDRLVIKWIYKIIKPLFKYIISPSCLHLKGPSGVKIAVKKLKKALEYRPFKYFIRADIRSYYASIDRNILVKQMQQHFNDPRLLKYLEDIINIPISSDATIFSPDKGIARRSSLSPFFGALYLSPLDQSFDKLKGVCYFRFMDDIIILAETKRQYLKAKKRLQDVLSKLKLSLSRHKTKMGKLEFGFHFLGVNFAVSQNQQNKSHTVISIHDRSCYRALDKINGMREGADYNPAKAQRYLSNWAMWWSKTVCVPYFGYFACLRHWIQITLKGRFYRDCKTGSGLFIT